MSRFGLGVRFWGVMRIVADGELMPYLKEQLLLSSYWFLTTGNGGRSDLSRESEKNLDFHV